MSDIKIIVASHGLFSQELVHSAEMIVGKMENVNSVSLLPNEALTDLMDKAVKLLEKSTDQTIVLVDLFGGTPCNVFTALLKKYDFHLYTGASLPMLIELYLKTSSTVEFDSDQWFEEYKSKLDESTVNVNDRIGGNQ